MKMQKQEAIKILEMFLHKQCDLERTKFAHTQSEVWHAVNMAKEALEKKTSPKKPVFKEPTDKLEEGCYACPECGGTVGVYDLRDNYCSDCGTKIDWSES